MVEEVNLYLGVDGGQSHTEAVIADEAGRVRGRGRGGASNHAEQIGGRERLRQAIVDSVGQALRAASGGERNFENTVFQSAHCAMTGGAEYKEEIIGGVLQAKKLVVAHDAPAALVGATGGAPGIVVIAGTGSVAYGETSGNRRLRLGGWGYTFGDDGSGYWLALQGVRRVMQAHDGLAEETALTELALDYFNYENLLALALALALPQGRITRDEFASFAKVVHQAGVDGDEVARAIVAEGGDYLAKLVASLARKAEFKVEEMNVACVGGVFRGELMRDAFNFALGAHLPQARVVPVRFDPATGALLLAYHNAGLSVNENLLTNLEGGSRSRA